MKFKILLFFIILLFYSFSSFFVELAGIITATSYITLFSDLVIIFLGIHSINFQHNKKFVLFFILLLFTSSLTLLFNFPDVTLLTHINGLREYLMLICGFLFVNNLIHSKYFLYFNSKFVIYCWAFLFFQIPASLIQYSKYGAGDMVGGGFGSGGSGVLSLAIFLTIFFLIVNSNIKNDNRDFRISQVLIFIPFLLPTFINETKLTFLLIFIFFMLLTPFKITKISRLVIMLVVALPVFFTMEAFYSSTTHTGLETVSRGASYDRIFSSEFLSKYLISEEVRSGKDVSRITKIYLAYELINDNPTDLGFGKGLGLFKGGSILQESKFSEKYHWLLSGTRPYLFFLLIQGGLIGALVTLLLILSSLLPRNISAAPFLVQRLQAFCMILLFIICLYNPAFRTGAFSILFVCVGLYVLNFQRIVALYRDNCRQFTNSMHASRNVFTPLNI